MRHVGPQTRSGAAYLAASGLALCVVVQLASVWFVAGHRTDDRALLIVDLAGLTAACAAAFALPWERMRRECLLVFPVGGCAAAYVLGRVAPHVAIAYAGLLILAFVFTGLTQRRGTSYPLALPAGCAWASMQPAGITGQLRVRLVLAMIIWTLVAEIIAWTMNELSRKQEELVALARRDALTGLDNRHALPAMFASYAPETALIMIDIDHFKRLNDEHGHAEGDRALQDFAHVLSAVLRGSDTAFRYGGEEFLVVAPRTGLDGADQLLCRIQVAWCAARPSMTFSAGLATWGVDETHAEAIARADAALYAAKNAGRDRWVVAEGESPAPAPRAVVAGEPADVRV